MEPLDHASNPRPRRRDVLAWGAGLALLPSVSWAGRGQCHGLAIGYRREPLDPDGPPNPVVAADRLAAGQASLARGARVTVHGIRGDAAGLAGRGIRSAELRVGFPIDSVEPAAVEFLAWSHQLLPVENAGASNSFAVPVDGGLALALEIETLGCERFESVLSLGRDPGQPKLRAGRYLIAPGAAEFHPRHFDVAASEPLIEISIEPLA